MNEYDCGCLIIADDASGYFIHACNKHNAAPDLLEACEEGAPKFGNGPDTLEELARQIEALAPDVLAGWPIVLRWKAEKERAAIAKARGS